MRLRLSFEFRVDRNRPEPEPGPSGTESLVIHQEQPRFIGFVPEPISYPEERLTP